MFSPDLSFGGNGASGGSLSAFLPVSTRRDSVRITIPAASNERINSAFTGADSNACAQ